MTSWNIERVIRQLAGKEFAKSVLAKALESNPEAREHLPHGISHQSNGRFRERFVARMSPEWQAHHALAALFSSGTNADIELAFESAFVTHIMAYHQKMIGTFLDSLNIRHEGGTIENIEDYELTNQKVNAAVGSLLESFAANDVRMYLAVAGIRMPKWSGVLWEALERTPSDSDTPATSEPEESSENVPPAVIPEHSTILDDIMTKAIVESVGGEGGALPAGYMEDAIDELITMDFSRDKSYFHRGFFHALTNTQDQTPSLEQTEPRRQWELVGEVFGLARQPDAKLLVDCWNSKSMELVRLMTERHPAGPRILPILWGALWESNLHTDALGLLRPEVLAACALEFKDKLLEEARAHRLLGLVDEARVIVDALDSATTIGDADQGGYVFELQRELAVCMRTQGHFDEAATLLQRLIEDSPDETIGDLNGLLGLCLANYRRVSEVTCLIEADQVKSSAERIREQLKYFEKAAQAEESLAVAIGCHCLGILAFLEGDAHAASGLLSRAFSAANRNSQTAGNADFMGQIQVALAMSIMLTVDEKRFNQAAEQLDSLSIENVTIPEWIATRLIDHAILVSDERSRHKLLKSMIDFAPGARDHLLAQTATEPGLLPEMIVRDLQGEIELAKTNHETKWRLTSWLAVRYAAEQDNDSTAHCLDLLEQIAIEHPLFRERYVAMYEQEGMFESAWSREEIVWSVAGIHEREANYESAVGILRGQFHDYAADDHWIEAYGILERARTYGLPAETLRDMEGRFLGQFESAELPTDEFENSPAVDPVRVLFVGGNEIHAKYDGGIQKSLAESAPWITVDFEHPGFGGNWGETANQLISRFPSYDALVVMTLIRTNLGRALRRHTDPDGLVWVACTGAGRQSIERSIRSGASLALKKRQRNSASVTL